MDLLSAAASAFMSAASYSSSTKLLVLPPSTQYYYSLVPLLPISTVRVQEEKPPTQPTSSTTAKISSTSTSSTRQSVQPAAKSSRAAAADAPRKLRLSSPRRAPQTGSFSATLCNALDVLINNFIDPAVLRPSVDPRRVLHDNFAPVDELPPTLCPVVRGSVPHCLAGGAYIRNGPNPQYLPRGPYHLFDGDGMLHSLLLPTAGGNAPATLCSRYVRTYRYQLERETGAQVLPSTFSAFHGLAGMARGAVSAARVLTGQMNPVEGVGLANTSLAFFGDRLYALGESDLPYAVHVSPESGEVSTLGRHDFNGRLMMAMTAHPKKDPVTGELFAFRYGPLPPFLSYFRFDAQGDKVGQDVPIFSMTHPSFLHDFAITERYAVFLDMQIVMKPLDMVVGGGSPVGTELGKVPRIGVLPRYATSEAEMRWFEVSGLNPVHVLNAWEEEEGDELVVVAPNTLGVEHALERTELVHACVEMVRLDLRGGRVLSRTPLSAGNLEFGVVHQGYLGRKNRYAYLGVGDPMPKIGGVVKLDFSLAGKRDCIVARRDFGPGCFAGEPFFVPKSEAEEDEGYLVCYVHDERKGKSTFVVMDARSPELDIVAEVALPGRVPYGFHGIFLTRNELRAQRPLPL